MTGMVFDIQNYSIYDGPGIRSTVYLKGCPLRCYWCHNPESQERAPQWLDRAGKRELVGREMSVDDVTDAVLADRPFFERSGGGVTLSGGEPTAQPDFAAALLRRLREEGVHTAVETCGLFSTAVLDEWLELVDLFLFDLKHMNAAAHLEGTRADNGQILKNFAGIIERGGPARVTPRFPLIPGFNTDPDNIEATLQFLSEQNYTGEVHLMPHHGWARAKYEGLGRGDDYRDAGEVQEAMLAAIADRFEERGFKAVCHG